LVAIPTAARLLSCLW